MQSIGVCLFEEPSLAGPGWASLNGGKPFRIAGAGDLSTSEVWVTNLDYRDYRSLNFDKAPHIYDQQYFRTSIKMLTAELGLMNQHKAASQVLSEIFTRVVSDATSTFGLSLNAPGFRFANLLAGAILPSAYRARPKGPNAAELQVAIDQSYQANQAMFNRRPPAGGIARVFTFPRERYANWLLSLPYPSSADWKPVNSRGAELIIGTEDGKEIKGTRAALQRLKERAETSSVLMRVQVQSIDPFFRDFATFAAGEKKPRRWAALPEIIEMARYAKLSIMGGYQTPCAPLPDLGRLQNQTGAFSFSRGLMLENLWVGLAGKINGTQTQTALGAYMRAYDRVVCNRIAEQFSRYNLVVGSYGTGRVVVYVPDNEVKAAAQLALARRVLPQLTMTEGVSIDGTL